MKKIRKLISRILLKFGYTPIVDNMIIKVENYQIIELKSKVEIPNRERFNSSYPDELYMVSRSRCIDQLLTEARRFIELKEEKEFGSWRIFASINICVKKE